MRTVRVCLPIMTVCALLVAAAPNSAVSKSGRTVVALDNLGAAANQELAAARRGTAKYHDIEQAFEDGYVQTTPCIPGEGAHFAKLPFDCVFDPADPEILHYVPQPNGDWKLIGVEYIVPKVACGLTTHPPEGFTGDADEWESEIGGTVWALNAFIWFGKPDVFAFRDDSITCD